MKHFCILLLILTGVDAGVADGESSQPKSLLDRLRQEAPRAQRELRDRYLDALSFQYREMTLIGPSDAREIGDGGFSIHSDFASRCAASSPGFVTEYMDNPERMKQFEDFTSRVICVNGKYGFVLERRDAATSWYVDSLGTGDIKEFLLRGRSTGLRSLSLEELLIHRRIPVLDIEAIPIDQFFLKTEITIDEIRQDSQGRVAVEFSGDIATPTGSDRVQGGTVWLLQNQSWAVDEYRVKLQSQFEDGPRVGEAHRIVEWTVVDELPVPSSVVTRYTAEGESTIENRYAFSNWQQKEFPPERFLLSHYGLPEPGMSVDDGSSRERMRSFFLWVTAIGAVFVIIAIVMRYRFPPGSANR